MIIVLNENEPPAYHPELAVFTMLETHPVGVELTAILPFISDQDDENLQEGELINQILYSMPSEQFDE
jgi:hypothetical protein